MRGLESVILKEVVGVAMPVWCWSGRDKEFDFAAWRVSRYVGRDVNRRWRNVNSELLVSPVYMGGRGTLRIFFITVIH